MERHSWSRGAAAAGILPRFVQRQARQEGGVAGRPVRQTLLLYHDNREYR